jgi:DNA helicase-2/ATP-dependent DNA helicase PcrA
MLGMLRQNTSGWPAELDLVRRWNSPHLERLHEDASLRESE